MENKTQPKERERERERERESHNIFSFIVSFKYFQELFAEM
jgi:hypothetical protein